MGPAGTAAARPDPASGWAVGGSPHGAQRDVLADPLWCPVAGRAALVRVWKTVYNRHRRWSGDGTLAGILDELRRDADVAEGPDWTIGVDGAVVRAHQHAAGARHEPPADIPAEVVATTELDTGGRVE